MGSSWPCAGLAGGGARVMSSPWPRAVAAGGVCPGGPCTGPRAASACGSWDNNWVPSPGVLSSSPSA
eukprot:1161855-Pelagomonas_calceolata.AAC.3